MAKYNKALVALGGAVVAIAGAAGLHIDPSVVTSVVGALTALLVLVVPNAEA